MVWKVACIDKFVRLKIQITANLIFAAEVWAANFTFQGPLTLFEQHKKLPTWTVRTRASDHKKVGALFYSRDPTTTRGHPINLVDREGGGGFQKVNESTHWWDKSSEMSLPGVPSNILKSSDTRKCFVIFRSRAFSERNL